MSLFISSPAFSQSYPSIPIRQMVEVINLSFVFQLFFHIFHFLALMCYILDINFIFQFSISIFKYIYFAL